MCIAVLFRGKAARGVKLSTDRRFLQRLSMGGAVSLLSLYDVMAQRRTLA